MCIQINKYDWRYYCTHDDAIVSLRLPSPVVGLCRVAKHFSMLDMNFMRPTNFTLCISRKYPYLPHGRDIFLRPPPLWKFQLSFIHFFKFFWPYRTPHPPGNSNGGSMDIFWNCTLKKLSPIKKVCFPKLDENTFKKELLHIVYGFRR